MLKIEPEFLKADGSDRYLLGCKQKDGSSTSYAFTMRDAAVDGIAFRSLQHEDSYYFAVSEDPSRDWLEEAIHYLDCARIEAQAANASDEMTPAGIVCSASSMDGHFEYRIIFGSTNSGAEGADNANGGDSAGTDPDAISNYKTVTVIDSGTRRTAESELGTCEAKLEGGWWTFKDDKETDLLKAILRFHESRFYSAEQVSHSFDLSRKQ
jgi:hypothetical protein